MVAIRAAVLVQRLVSEPLDDSFSRPRLIGFEEQAASGFVGVGYLSISRRVADRETLRISVAGCNSRNASGPALQGGKSESMKCCGGVTPRRRWTTAVHVVIQHEGALRRVEDVSAKKLGNDLTSLHSGSGDQRLIEVKARRGHGQPSLDAQREPSRKGTTGPLLAARRHRLLPCSCAERPDPRSGPAVMAPRGEDATLLPERLRDDSPNPEGGAVGCPKDVLARRCLSRRESRVPEASRPMKPPE